MNKTMMEFKLDGSSNFKFLEDKNSKEDLLWVIQKCVTVTYLLHEDVKRTKINHEPLEKSYQLSTPSGMKLYIYYLYRCHEGNCRRKEHFVDVMDSEGSQWIQRKNTLKVKTSRFVGVL
jgi:hypothetical protein